METKKIEQASWIGRDEPGILMSLANFTRVHVGTLLDGAYLGISGENILVRTPDNGSGLDFDVMGSPSGRRIAAINPGIKKVSKFLESRITGDVLAKMESRKFYSLTHDEAIQEGLLVKKDYSEIFFYNGDLDLASFYEKLQTHLAHPDNSPVESQWLIRAINQTLEHILEIPESTYQVTKKGSGHIFLVNKEQIS